MNFGLTMPEFTRPESAATCVRNVELYWSIAQPGRYLQAGADAHQALHPRVAVALDDVCEAERAVRIRIRSCDEKEPKRWNVVVADSDTGGRCHAALGVKVRNALIPETKRLSSCSRWSPHAKVNGGGVIECAGALGAPGTSLAGQYET